MRAQRILRHISPPGGDRHTDTLRALGLHFNEHQTAFLLSTSTQITNTRQTACKWLKQQAEPLQASHRSHTLSTKGPAFSSPFLGKHFPFLNSVGFFLFYFVCFSLDCKREWTESSYFMREKDPNRLKNTASQQTPFQGVHWWRVVLWADNTSCPRSAGLPG